jgi:nuclear RNA export factor
MNRQENTTKIEIRGWEGGSRDDLVNFIFRKAHCKLLNVYISGPVLYANVWSDQAAPLIKWSGVKFAGQSLRISLGEAAGNQPGAQVGDTITTLQTFLQSRFNPALNLLDLQNMRGDQLLVSKGLFATASTSSKMFPALMKIASEKLPQVVSVNLAENNLQDISGITTLSQTYPNLQNLSLANNSIGKARNLELWRHKFRNLRELILSGNPITSEATYKDDIMKLFPRLIVLDGVVIRDESQLDTLKLPLPIKQTFFENPDVQSVAGNFVTNYFDLFDRDRSQLMGLYDDVSTFSLSVDSVSPRVFNPAGGSQGWSPYIPISRNLTKTGHTAKHNRLAIGPQSIAGTFHKLPSTKHDLSPEKFAIEVWRTSGVRVAGDAAIVINIHGEFQDLQSNMKRSFDRVFILLNSPTGSIIVTSDMLTVRGYAGIDAWVESKTVSNGVQVQAPQPPSTTGIQRSPTPAVIGNTNNPATPIPPELNGLSPDQIAGIQKLMAETRLNPHYARMCLEQANFDLNQALALFQQSRPQLPPDAFQ